MKLRQLPQPSFNLIKRSEGQSFTEKAAYNARESIQDHRTDKVFDEHSTREDLVTAGMLAKPGSESLTVNREKTANLIEASERRKDAQVGRAATIPLPRELSVEQNIEMLKDYLVSTFVAESMFVDYAVHSVVASDGLPNLHAHVLLSLRETVGDGFAKKKNRDWNKVEALEKWRQDFEDIANKHLEDAGSDTRITIQSYEKQGINKQPGEHLGTRNWEAEKKGVRTKKGDWNRRIANDNNIRRIVDEIPEDQLHLPKAVPVRAMAQSDSIQSPEAIEHRRKAIRTVRAIDPTKFDDPVYYQQHLQAQGDEMGLEIAERDQDGEWQIAAVPSELVDSADQSQEQQEKTGFWKKYTQQNEREDDGYER